MCTILSFKSKKLVLKFNPKYLSRRIWTAYHGLKILPKEKKVPFSSPNSLLAACYLCFALFFMLLYLTLKWAFSKLLFCNAKWEGGERGGRGRKINFCGQKKRERNWLEIKFIGLDRIVNFENRINNISSCHTIYSQREGERIKITKKWMCQVAICHLPTGWNRCQHSAASVSELFTRVESHLPTSPSTTPPPPHMFTGFEHEKILSGHQV